MTTYSRIIFSRPRWRPQDTPRSYLLELDGKPRGRLKAGGELSLDVMPGRHVVQARAGWTGSTPKEIRIAPESVTRVRVKPSGGPFKIFLVFTRTRGIKLTVEGH
jgi:hypothetical protein